ncbi:MAG: phosphotransferase [Actinomycetia bacterium]|nr:phosphotransferase [Actinomycetes bacterium]
MSMLFRRSDSPPEASTSSVPDQDPLSWVSNILWPDGTARLALEDRHRSDGETQARWWASPSTQQPRILIPAESMVVARRAVRRYHDGVDLQHWTRSHVAEIMMSLPPVAHCLLGDRVVVVDGPADSIRQGVLGGLQELLGLDNLSFAISLAAPKTNRKPVIQILDETGLVLGWAKIAWNSWTEGLVANEARWLSPPSPKPPIIVPTLLEDTVLFGRRVVVTSSIAAGRRFRTLNSAKPDPGVLRAIAAMGSTSRRPVAESAWWASVVRVLPVADDWERQSIDSAAADADGIAFSLGAWHGDFTPWNVMTARGLAQVIDWEFAADEVPLGFDLHHYHTQVASERLRLVPDEALDYSARHSPQGLSLLGIVDPHTQIATWKLYLVELIRRTLALRAAGQPTADVRHGQAAVRRLARMQLS